jgi:hypothetical protein
VPLQRPGAKPSPQPTSGVGGREQMKADRIKAAADARQAKELAKARAQQVGWCHRLQLLPCMGRLGYREVRESLQEHLAALGFNVCLW